MVAYLFCTDFWSFIKLGRSFGPRLVELAWCCVFYFLFFRLCGLCGKDLTSCFIALFCATSGSVIGCKDMFVCR